MPRKAPNSLAWRPSRRAMTALAATCALVACATAPREPETLYQRLGGAPRVQLVVDRTLDRTSTDPRTRRSFDGIKIAAIKESLAQQICSISGGGCHYEGETMKNAHHDSRIAASEFDAMVTILREELDRAGVDAAAKNDLLRLLAPMKRDVIDGGIHARGV